MAKNYGEEVKFDAVLSKLMFETDDYRICAVRVNRFKFPKIELHPQYYTAVIKGSAIVDMEKDLTYHIVTHEVTDAKYPQKAYEVINMSADVPKTPADIIAFLSTVLTPLQAQTLYATYPNILDLVEHNKTDSVDLSKLKGITTNNFEKIVSKIRENFFMADICARFYNLLSLQVLRKLEKKYGSAERIVEVLNNNPYDALTKVTGIGFRKADAIVLTIEENASNETGIENLQVFKFSREFKISKERCMACMEYYLEENENEGSTVMLLSDLKSKVSTYTSESAVYFDECLEDSRFYIDKIKKTISRKYTYEAEMYIAQAIIKANKNPIRWDVDLSKYTSINEFVLTDEQRKIQELVCRNNVSVLSGPAGTGKSSSVQSIIEMLDDCKLSYAIAAPSAKAAKVIANYTKRPSKTIHRLLGATGSGFAYGRDPETGVERKLSYDIIIIDEASMIDVFLMKKLLEAIDFEQTKLLLVGDPAQLAAVGCGLPYFDIINSGVVPNNMLTKIFRYSEGGLITVATDSRNGKQFLPSAPCNKPVPFGNSFFFIPCNTANVVDSAVKVYKKLLSKSSLEEVTVLSSYNKGECGVEAINAKIQQEINPKPADQIFKFKNDETQYEYRVDDLIMQTKNDYKSVICNESGEPLGCEDGEGETLIANGEVGRVHAIVPNGIVVRYDNYYILRGKSELLNTQLGYSLSTHKSQGSGYKYVVIVMPSSHNYMLNQNLIYTAITRAKEQCVLLGSQKNINMAVHKKETMTRRTNLLDLLKELNKENT